MTKDKTDRYDKETDESRGREYAEGDQNAEELADKERLAEHREKHGNREEDTC